MGKIFLILLACVSGYSIWSFTRSDEEAEVPPDEEVATVPERSDRDVEPVAKSVPAEVVHDVLFVVATYGRKLQVLDWGWCEEGDILPCGRELRRWSNKLAVVFDGVSEKAIRFARFSEFPEPDPPAVSAETAGTSVQSTNGENGPVESGLGVAFGGLFGGGQK